MLMVAIAVVTLTLRFAWARNAYLLAPLMALWVVYRTSTHITVEEVPAEEVPTGIVEEPEVRAS
jgi:hypothetical protein